MTFWVSRPEAIICQFNAGVLNGPGRASPTTSVGGRTNMVTAASGGRLSSTRVPHAITSVMGYRQPDRVDSFAVGLILTESLILAQDERWRRA